MIVRDGDFRDMWAEHEAAPLDSALVRVKTDEFGDLTFAQQAVSPPGLEDHVLLILRAELASSVAAMAMEMGGK